MSEDVDSPPADDVLVARPFEGFERCLATPPPPPPRSVAADLLSCAGSFVSFSASAFVAFVVLAGLTPIHGQTGSTRSSQERRLERERAVAEALAEAGPDHATR